MAKFPDAVYVYGFRVPVTYSKRRPQWAPKRAVFGCVDFRDGAPRIWVNNTGNAGDDRSTLLHELAHIAFASRDLTFMSSEGEEIVVRVIEATFNDVLSRNPALVALYGGT